MNSNVSELGHMADFYQSAYSPEASGPISVRKLRVFGFSHRRSRDVYFTGI